MPTFFSFKALIKVAIVLIWVGLTVALIQRNQMLPNVVITPEEDLEDAETFMAVYFRDQKVGYSERVISKRQDGYFVSQNIYLRLNLMGSVQELRTLTTAELSPDMALNSFDFYMSAGPIKYNLKGWVRDMKMDLVGITGGYESRSTIPLNDVPRLALSLMPYLATQGLEKGQQFQVPIFDPSTLSNTVVRVVVEDREKIEFGDETVEAHRLRFDYHDNQSYTWVDTEGRVLKEEGFMGLSMVRTTEEEARKGLAGGAEMADVVAATSAPSSARIDNPRQIKRLEVRLLEVKLDGLDIDGPRQTLQGDTVSILQETIDPNEVRFVGPDEQEFRQYLGPTNLVQSEHREIKALAQKIAGKTESPLERIKAVNNWVYRTLEKRPTLSVPNALSVMKTKVGDCNEHAVLTTALLRALKVPARISVGVLYYQGRFYYHAWVEAYYGRWIAIDPLLGQMPADATHIRLLTGELHRQAELVRIIGRLQVEIVEKQ
jgi:hypothetical protein